MQGARSQHCHSLRARDPSPPAAGDRSALRACKCHPPGEQAGRTAQHGHHPQRPSSWGGFRHWKKGYACGGRAVCFPFCLPGVGLVPVLAEMGPWGGGLWDTLSSGCSVARTTWWEGHRVPRKEDVRPGQRRLVWLRSPPQWTLASIPWAARDRLRLADGWGGHLLGDRARRRPGCPTACKGPLGPSGFESQCSQLPCWLCGSRVRPQTASGRRRLMLVG